MKIKNATMSFLTISGKKIAPKKSIEWTMMRFGTVNIHSEIGICSITSEFGTYCFKNTGKIKARCERNKEGKKTGNIIIYN